MPVLVLRPVVHDDVAALLALQQRAEAAWFGAVETDEAEFREMFGLAEDLERDSRIVESEHRPAAVAWVWGRAEAVVHADPAVPAAVRGAAYDALLPWLSERRATRVEALRQDGQLLAALARHGWEPWVSEFELLRAPDTPVLDAPAWPAGVRLTGLDVDAHARAVHALLYDRSSWLDVPGHAERAYDTWAALFCTYDGYDPQGQVVAWHGHEPVGLALGRTFSDGTGWVSQLAVAREWQRRGLGRALLLEALRLREAGGARQVGLSVSAGNAGALRLYTSVGLRVDREWVRHRPRDR